MQAATILTLPPDLLIEIFKRAPDATVSAVCKRFQRVCHTRTTAVTFTRPYEFRHDDAFVALVASLPQLTRARISPGALHQAWNWPVSALTNVRRLSIPRDWPRNELPGESSNLEVLEVRTKGDDIEWFQAAFDRVPAACVMHADGMGFNEEGLPRRPYHLAATWAGRAHCKHLSFGTLDMSPAEFQSVMREFDYSRFESISIVGEGRACLELPNVLDVLASSASGLPQLTLLCLEVSGISSLDGLARARMPKLASLRVACTTLTSLGDLGLSGTTQLTLLHLDFVNEYLAPTNHAHLSSLGFLASATLSSLRDLAFSGSTSLRDLDSLALQRASLGCLTALKITYCPQLTDISALRDCGLTALQQLRIFSCHSLARIEGVTGASMPQLTLLDFSSTEIASLQGLRGSALATLRELKLCDCTALTTLDGLAGACLASLSHIDVSCCGGLRCCKDWCVPALASRIR